MMYLNFKIKLYKKADKNIIDYINIFQVKKYHLFCKFLNKFFSKKILVLIKLGVNYGVFTVIRVMIDLWIPSILNPESQFQRSLINILFKIIRRIFYKNLEEKTNKINTFNFNHRSSWRRTTG